MILLKNFAIKCVWRCGDMYGGMSSIGALLLLTEGLTSLLLLNHGRRVGFPATLCMLSRGRSL